MFIMFYLYNVYNVYLKYLNHFSNPPSVGSYKKHQKEANPGCRFINITFYVLPVTQTFIESQRHDEYFL